MLLFQLVHQELVVHLNVLQSHLHPLQQLHQDNQLVHQTHHHIYHLHHIQKDLTLQQHLIQLPQLLQQHPIQLHHQLDLNLQQQHQKDHLVHQTHLTIDLPLHIPTHQLVEVVVDQVDLQDQVVV